MGHLPTRLLAICVSSEKYLVTSSRHWAKGVGVPLQAAPSPHWHRGVSDSCPPAHRQLLKTELGSFFTEYLQVGALCSPEGLLPELARKGGGRGHWLPVGTWSSGFKVSTWP